MKIKKLKLSKKVKSIILISLVVLIGSGILLYNEVQKQQEIGKRKLLEQIGADTNNESNPNAPELSNGMIPVKWNGTNWVVTTEDDPEWYNYGDKKWANVMLEDDLAYDENRNITSSGSMYVWIPRYAYKITHGYHTNEIGEVETVFLQGKSNLTAYTKGINEEITNTTAGENNWLVPPAFTYDGEEVEGIWVAKYKARSQNKTAGNNILQRIRVNNTGTTWTNIPINSAFSLCIEMNNRENEYGLLNNDNIVDPHLIKNSEWAAVAYLSYSGIGYGLPISNANISTTGNETGIYEVSGQYEYTATYVENDNKNLEKYNDVLINAENKYKDVLSKGANDSEIDNYNMTSKNYGNAIYETSSGVNSESWYGGSSDFPSTTYPNLIRGANLGLFSFTRANGLASSNIGFRPVIIVKNVDENDIKINVVSKVATNQDVKVQISYGDVSIVNEDRYQYRLNDTEWKTADKNQEIIVSKNNTTVYARIYDGINPIKQITYEINNIDTASPNSFNINSKNIANIHDIGFTVIDVQATDNQSGVKKYEYIIKNGNQELVYEDAEIEGLVHNTTYEFFVRAYDYAGNTRDSNHIQVKTKDILGKPKLTQGMIPVKWNGSSWIETTVDDDEWYDYNSKKWANVKLEDGSMMVWIPKYAYKITSGYHTSQAGTIEIEILNGSKGIERQQGILDIKNKKGTDNWNVPTAFTYGNTNIEGYWVAKYEASQSEDGTAKFIRKASSWRNISISDCFNKCIAMTSEDNPYGLISNNEKISPHLLKNTEWGAIAYLAQSSFGKESEVSVNSLYVTGSVGSSEQFESNEGQASSTTGNIYGIYDMAGGSREYVAGYINNTSPKNYGTSIMESDAKYSDTYYINNSDSEYYNYYNSYKNNLADAIYETSKAQVSWYESSKTSFAYGSYCWLTRGGSRSDGGIYKFEALNGGATSSTGFRSAIVVTEDEKTGQIDAPRIKYEISEDKRSATVTIFYDSQIATKKQYKIGNGNLQDYTGPFVVKDNNIDIYAENTNGKTTANSTQKITGVWTIKIPEFKPVYAENGSNLTITIDYDSKATRKQYKIEDGEWIDYTGPIEIIQNNVTIYAENENADGEFASSSYKSEGIVPAGVIGIRTAEELNLVRNDPTQKYGLLNDIDLSSYENWTPIPNFTGELYGGNYTIKNLSITNTDYRTGNQGLFGTVGANAKINDLKLENVNINVKGTNNGALVGCINGNNVEITNIEVNGQISGANDTGGLIGYVSSGNVTISNVKTKGNVVGSQYTGGIIGQFGYNSSSSTNIISNSYSESTVQGTTYVGGLIGDGNYSTTENCYTTGTVTGTSDYVGGLVGRQHYGTVRKSYAIGEVKGGSYVGGLIGYSGYATTENCYATGKVSGASYIGGLIGYLYSGSSSKYATVNTSYAMGEIIATGNNVGGLVGYKNSSYSTITNSYYITEGNKVVTNGLGTEIIAYVTAVQKTPYVGFDFDYIWNIQEGKSTPYLRDVVIPNSVYLENMENIYDGDGQGTEENPYEIRTVSDLKNVTKSPSSHYKIMNDLDLSSEENWVPIEGFFGKIDGQNYKIKNFSITSTDTKLNNQGLFASISNGCQLKNIKLENVNINVKGQNNGALVGHIFGTNVEISNIEINGQITGGDYTGGLIGFVTNTNITINNVNSKGEVTGTQFIGGIVGRLGNTNSNTSNVSIKNSYSSSNVKGTSYYVGGLIGYSNYATVENCYATGKVEGTYNSVGGLIGYQNYGTTNKTYAIGEVTGSSYIGGLVGYKDYGEISNSYATGKVTGSSYVGGLVGRHYYGTITHTYAMGEIVATGNDKGGLEGNRYGGTLTNGYYITEGSKIIANGLGTEIVSYVTATKEETYSGFDFTEIWKIEEGKSTPYLKNMVIPDCVYLKNIENIYQGEGNGTEENPYQIKTVEDLKNVAKSPASHYKIMNDLDLSSEENWTPIEGFYGRIDGQNYKIKNLSITSTDTKLNNQGLFGSINNGCQLKNIKLENVNVNVKGQYNGALVGYVFGTNIEISNIEVNGQIIGADYTGGIIGFVTNTNVTINNVNSTGEVIGAQNTGGLIGRLGNNNSNTSNVSIKNSYSSSNVKGTSYYVGGLIGYSNYATVENCYATGKVEGTYNSVGGLIGYQNYGTTSKTYATGDVTGSSYIGGLVGYKDYGEISNSYATGKITGSSYVGGLVGRHYYGTIINTYAMGEIVATGNDKGGLEGNRYSGTLTNGYYITEGSKVIANGLGTEIVSFVTGAKGETYSGFDFTEIWKIEEGKSTPYLKNMVTPNSVYLKNIENIYQGEGNGTEENPYQIKTVEDLKNVAKSPASYYKIMNDLDLSSEENWIPIEGFYGRIDGQNYKIKNLSITSTNTKLNNQGLFGSINNGCQLKNIKLENVNINVKGQYNGALVGYVFGTNVEISNIEVNGQIIGGDYTGSIIGFVTNTNVTISNVNSTGQVTGMQYTGGLIGRLGSSNSSTSNVIIKNSYSSSNIKGTSYYVGGLIGYSYYSTVENCYATGTVTSSSYYVGGLIGYQDYGTINKTYAIGEVTGGQYTGGLAGYKNYGTISNSFATGKVTGSSYVGGLIGRHYYGTTTNTYAIGEIVSTGSNIGGLEGNRYGGTLTNGYYITEGSKVIANGLGTEIVSFVTGAKNATYMGFDFTDIWQIQEGTTMPYLRNMVIPNSVYLKNLENIYIGEGQGTEENPYQIKTVQDLKNVTKSPASYYKIMNDLDLSSEENWTPIVGFFGRIDGQNYKIKNLSITSTNTKLNNQGLFGSINNGCQLKNIKLENVNINVKGQYNGALVGYVFGTNVEISNIEVNGQIIGGDYTGGLIGFVTNTNVTISNVNSTGQVTGTQYTGGLIGRLGSSNSSTSNVIIKNSYSSSNIKGTSYYVGGLIGYSYYSTVENCYAIGTVTSSSYYVGGLIGYQDYGTINKTYAIGEVTGGQYTGGLAGYKNYGTISNSFATGKVTGSSYVGGLIGRHYYGTTTNTYAIGEVAATGSNKGGLLGNRYGGTLTNGYYITEGSKITDSYGTAIDTFVNGAKAATYTGFDFTDTWQIQEGKTTPYIKGMVIPSSVYLSNH